MRCQSQKSASYQLVHSVVQPGEVQAGHVTQDVKLRFAAEHRRGFEHAESLLLQLPESCSCGFPE